METVMAYDPKEGIADLKDGDVLENIRALLKQRPGAHFYVAIIPDVPDRGDMEGDMVLMMDGDLYHQLIAAQCILQSTLGEIRNMVKEQPSLGGLATVLALEGIFEKLVSMTGGRLAGESARIEVNLGLKDKK
jgi:hypothetical protein